MTNYFCSSMEYFLGFFTKIPKTLLVLSNTATRSVLHISINFTILKALSGAWGSIVVKALRY
jgi:glutathione synthase/RimK-type ligase-like ATP-grasp enzyme